MNRGQILASTNRVLTSPGMGWLSNTLFVLLIALVGATMVALALDLASKVEHRFQAGS